MNFPAPARATAALALTLAAAGLFTSSADAQTVRIVSYNIAADTNSDGSGTLGAGLETVLQGIGADQLNDNGVPNAQPIDVLALEEVTTTSGGASTDAMLQSIVNGLNATYGAGTYAYDPTIDPTSGNLTGNGPSALIYNTKTIQVVSATPLGTASGSGAPRAPMQYVLQPVGDTSAADFYLDVSHTKSGTTSSDADRRNIEATTLVNNLTSLGANAHVVAVGDFNITSGSSEQTYQTLTANTAGSSFHDSAHPSGAWDDQTTAERQAISSLLSESGSAVDYRDDIQFVSAAAMAGSLSPGLQYEAGSFDVFGNGGNSALAGHSITSSSNIGVFPDLTTSQRDALLDALSTASDHLPTVADYDIVPASTPAPEPASLALLACGTLALLTRRRARPCK